MSYVIKLLYPPTHHDVSKLRLLESLKALYTQLHGDKSNDCLLLSPYEVWPAIYHNRLWIAFEKKKIIAMGFLILCNKPIASESYGVIHDIVTDENHRGKVPTVKVSAKNNTRVYINQSLAKSLVQEIIRCAEMQGLKYLELSSKPDRIEANRLYQSLGFQSVALANPNVPNSTNLYRLYLTKKKS